MIDCTSEFQSLDPEESMGTIDRLVIENENLLRKLHTLPVIEQAKGILMGRHGIPADDAFEMLRRQSQDTNTKLHLVAQSIISRGCPAAATDGPPRLDSSATASAPPKDERLVSVERSGVVESAGFE